MWTSRREARPSLRLVLLLCVALAGASAPRAHAEADRTTAATARANRILELFARQSGVPGFAVGVARHGQVLWKREDGWADVELRAPVTEATLFRVGSLSKSLTAALLARLHQEGRIDLDAPVQRYVPSFPEKEGGPITLRQIAGHLAGLRHYGEDESLNREPIRDFTSTLAQFENDPLEAPPGTAYHYSSFGYVLLGAALQAACGADYETCLDDEVLKPLGLEHIVPDVPERIVPGRTRFYSRDRGGLANAPYSDRIYKLPAGGHLSTLGDLLGFGQGMLGSSFLSAESRALLFSSQKTAAGEATGYGMGWRTGTDWQSRPVVHHGGQSEGGRAFLMVYPADELVIAFLANQSPTPFFEQEAWTLAPVFLDDPEALSGDEWSTISGSYALAVPGKESTVVAGRLELVQEDGSGRGWLTLDDERRTAIEIVLATRLGEEVWIVGGGRNGLMNLWARFDGEGFSGRWDWLGRTGAIEGRRLPPP